LTHSEEVQTFIQVEATVLSSSSEVFAILEQYRPEVIVLDVDLLQINGLDLCRMIRCNPKWASVPILILTSSITEDHRSQIFDIGADDFIVKPIVQGELEIRLRLVLPGLTV
jgi:DNA-binding response OmpR family regulator